MVNKNAVGPTLYDRGLFQKVRALALRSFNAILPVGMMVRASMLVALAADDPITSGIKSGLGQVYSILRILAIPVVVIAVSMCVYYLAFGGTDGVKKTKQVVIYTVVGLALLFLAPALVYTVQGWFSSGNDSINREVFGSTFGG